MRMTYKLWVVVAALISALMLPAHGQMQESQMPGRAPESRQEQSAPQPEPAPSVPLAQPTPSTQPASPTIAAQPPQSVTHAAPVDAPPTTAGDTSTTPVVSPPTVPPPTRQLPSAAPSPVSSTQNSPEDSPENNPEPSSNWPSMIAGEGGTAGETNESPAPIAALNQSLPQDLSPYGMFTQADFVVKSVMIMLAFSSILTWIIWLAKSLEICMAKRKVARSLKSIIAARSLAEAIGVMDNKKGVAVRLITAASEEVRVSLGAVDGAGSDGLKERINSHLYRIEVKAGRVMSRGTGILATIGAVAPFVGLFGTVWGVMNSFIGISHAQTTNLAVVAPGIAEALLATAIGLVAAIPAVVIFNMFARSITVYRQMLGDVSATIERLVSRDLDFRLAHKRAGKLVLSTAAE